MIGFDRKTLPIVILSFLLVMLATACGTRGGESDLSKPESAQAGPAAALGAGAGVSMMGGAMHGGAGAGAQAGHDMSAMADPAMHDDMAAGTHDDVLMATHEDMAAMHSVPAEAAAVENPFEADEASIARGAELFQANCAACHGPSGAGDGPAAAGLNPKPANLSDGHVQGNTDGSIFYVISEGSAGTAMPSWKATIDEEDRWHLVNYVRTLPDSQ